MTQLGRISGPLLDANLVRNGVDLTFRNHNVSDDLLYLNVSTKLLGVNKTPISRQVEVDGTIHTEDLIATTSGDIASILISTNTFTTDISTSINIRPNAVNPIVTMDHMQAGDLDFKDNIIKNNSVNGSIVFDPHGSGIVDLYANATVNGDLSVLGYAEISGNLTEYTNIIIGDSPIDTVVVNPDFTQSIVPGDDLTYDLGSLTKRWANVYAHENLDIGTLHYNDITVSLQMFIESSEPKISTLLSNDDLILNSDTGNVFIERFRFNGDEILDIDETVSTIGSTGIGYVRFVATNGLVVPVGDDSQRSGFPSTPEVGATRWNTEDPADNYLECFDGTTWSIATGASGTVSATQNYDLANAYILMLG